jgi:hypothetical protein
MTFSNIFYSLNYLQAARNGTYFYHEVTAEERQKKIRNGV